MPPPIRLVKHQQRHPTNRVFFKKLFALTRKEAGDSQRYRGCVPKGCWMLPQKDSGWGSKKRTHRNGLTWPNNFSTTPSNRRPCGPIQKHPPKPIMQLKSAKPTCDLEECARRAWDLSPPRTSSKALVVKSPKPLPTLGRISRPSGQLRRQEAMQRGSGSGRSEGGELSQRRRWGASSWLLWKDTHCCGCGCGCGCGGCSSQWLAFDT